MLYLLYEVLHLEHLGLLFLEAIFCSEIDQRCYDNPISTTTSWSLSMLLKSHNNAPPSWQSEIILHALDVYYNFTSTHQA
jgi:hypothetical protein